MKVAMGFAIWRVLLLCGGFLVLSQNGALAMSNVIPTDYSNMTCHLSSGKEGMCVYAYLCEDDKIVTDGTGIIDLRYSDDCEDYFLKCCSKESPCADNTGTCVAKNRCGANLNASNNKKFKTSEECDWSGYQCCPNDDIKQGDSTSSEKKGNDSTSNEKNEPENDESESDCDEGFICVPENQCQVDTAGIGIIKARFASCDGSNTCCPQSQVKKTGSSSCEMVGGTCVQQGKCKSPFNIDVRTERCPVDGFECCMDNAQAATTRKPSTEGKKCFHDRGVCTQIADCEGNKYTDRRNECAGLTCCGSPRSGARATTEQPADEVQEPTTVPSEQSDDDTCDSMGGTCETARSCSKTGGTIVKNAADCGSRTVCCKPKDSSNSGENTKDSGEVPANSGEDTKTSGETQKNSGENPNNSQETPTEPEIKDCGYRNEGGIKFDTQGREDGESQYGEFPWMVALMVNGTGKNKLTCGGTLIDPEVVITTAECVKLFKRTPEKLIVRAGEWDMGATMEPVPHQERQVLKIKSHAEFKPTTLVNNIALLFLDDKFDFTQTINTICLPPQDFSIDNGELIATGWGTTPQNRTKYQQILKSIDLPYTQKSDCERTLRRATGNRRFNLHKSFICAGGEPGIDTCKGDAGSPVVFQIPDDSESRYYAVGMVSWGVGCGRAGTPAVYTDIGKFRDWIDKEMEAEGLQTNYYEYQSQNSDDNE